MVDLLAANCILRKHVLCLLLSLDIFQSVQFIVVHLCYYRIKLDQECLDFP